MENRNCSVSECEKHAQVKGLCRTHYNRLWSNGTTELLERPPKARKCDVQDCDRPHKGNGYCNMHRQRFAKYGSPDCPPKVLCAGPECIRLVSAAHSKCGLCRSHRAQLERGGELRPLLNLERPEFCLYEGCGRKHRSKGYCGPHSKLVREGRPLRPIRSVRPPGPCAVEGCDSEHQVNGYCRRHNSALVSRWRRYGISFKDVEQMWKDQGQACAICRVSSGLLDLNVDHDHTCCDLIGRRACGRCVRGLLCTPCNTGLGLLLDQPDRLRAAADYLEARSLTPR